MSKIGAVFKIFKNFTVKNSPQILIGAGIAFMGSAVGLAIKETPKAIELLKKDPVAVDLEDKKVKRKLKNAAHTFKVTWKAYVPAAVTFSAGAACFIGSSAIHTKRNLALASAYGLAQTALTDYRKAAPEVVGEKSANDISNKVAENKLGKVLSDDKKEKDEKEPSTVMSISDASEVWVYDSFTGRYQKMNPNEIKRAENELNRRLLTDMTVPLNDFYDLIGMEPASCGDVLGWAFDGTDSIEIECTSGLYEDTIPYITVSFYPVPQYEFNYIYE